MSDFTPGTKNYEIFNLSAPYANPYQGSAERWLFVCSAGLLRSPTGAALAIQKGFNARSCGSHVDYALIPISANLIYWADKICFVSKKNYTRTLAIFDCDQEICAEIEDKKVVLDIKDQYEYMQDELVKEFETQLFSPPTSIATSPAVQLAQAQAVEAPVAPVTTV